MRRVLILGGGFGGVATAHTLRGRLDPEDEIIVVDRRDHFMVGFRKTWALTGTSTLAEGQRPLAALNDRGITFKQGKITAIDPANKAAVIDGERIEADALVVALGAQAAPERVPGLKEHALDVYGAANIPHAHEVISEFGGGRVVVGIFGEPYPCPPAPYEIAIMLQEFFAGRGVEAEMHIFTPHPMSLPIIGGTGCSVLESRMSDYGIRFRANRKATGVENSEVLFENGDRQPYDLLVGIPPHKCPDVITESGLTGDVPWIAPDPRTLETSYADVYAIGDCTTIPLADGKKLPKAGIFAENHGKIAAARIAARLAGDEPTDRYEGAGFCFLEFGGGAAAFVRGDFYTQPAPTAVLTDIAPEHLEAKKQFEAERLEAWFGG